MSNHDAYYAGIVAARGLASYHSKRAHLEVMFRDRTEAEAFMEHFGGFGKITTETPRYNRDRRNHVYRVRGLAAQDIIKRVLPYLQGRTAEACESVLARCNKAA
jgi:hypothetical protein